MMKKLFTVFSVDISLAALNQKCHHLQFNCQKINRKIILLFFVRLGMRNRFLYLFSFVVFGFF